MNGINELIAANLLLFVRANECSLNDRSMKSQLERKKLQEKTATQDGDADEENDGRRRFDMQFLLLANNDFNTQLLF